MGYNIGIDGPAGAGKSTVAKLIAKEKKFIYVDTGSLYRAIAVYMLKNNIDYNVPLNVEKNLSALDIRLQYVDGDQRVILNLEDVTSKLRTEEVSIAASIVAAIPKVRQKLVDIQRTIAKDNDVVMDGRDITSVVLPNANLKIYLDASVDERAKRRFLELKEKNQESSLENIKKDIIDRDERDMTRAISPLIRVEDAIYLDVSNITALEASDIIINLIKKNHE